MYFAASNMRSFLSFAEHNGLIACLLDRNFKSSPIRIVNPGGYNTGGFYEERIALGDNPA